MRDVSDIIDFRQGGKTPLMIAAGGGWKDGCWELLRNDANIDAKDDRGMTALQHAETNKRKEVVAFFKDWVKPDEEVVESQATRLKRETMEAMKSEKAAKAKADMDKDVAAKDAAFAEKDRIEAELKAASALSKWDEVKSALDTLSTEVKIAREDGAVDAPDAGVIDATLCTVRVYRQKFSLSRMPLVPTPARVKLLQACDQSHSSRLSTFLPVHTVNCVQTH
jgi:hypothetical protein